MAATETRLLLLGAVLLFEPVNGYQVRRELMSWGVDDWGHINPGSIYSGFTTLTKQGHLERHDLVEKDRPVAVYTSTDPVRAEFERLARVSLETVDPLSPLPFHTALALVPLLPRQRVKEHLEKRLDHVDRRRAEADSTPFDADVIGIVLTLLIGGACAAASNALALTTKSESHGSRHQHGDDAGPAALRHPAAHVDRP